MMHENSYYTISAETKFRYEDFGGVIYRRTADKLHFVNSRLAVALLFAAGGGSVGEIWAELRAQFPEASLNQVLAMLQRWEELGVITVTDTKT